MDTTELFRENVVDDARVRKNELMNGVREDLFTDLVLFAYSCCTACTIIY